MDEKMLEKILLAIQSIGSGQECMIQELQNVKENQEKLDKQIGELTVQIDSLERKVDDLAVRVDIIEKQIKELYVQVEKINKQIQELYAFQQEFIGIVTYHTEETNRKVEVNKRENTHEHTQFKNRLYTLECYK